MKKISKRALACFQAEMLKTSFAVLTVIAIGAVCGFFQNLGHNTGVSLLAALVLGAVISSFFFIRRTRIFIFMKHQLDANEDKNMGTELD